MKKRLPHQQDTFARGSDISRGKKERRKLKRWIEERRRDIPWISRPEIASCFNPLLYIAGPAGRGNLGAKSRKRSTRSEPSLTGSLSFPKCSIGSVATIVITGRGRHICLGLTCQRSNRSDIDRIFQRGRPPQPRTASQNCRFCSRHPFSSSKSLVSF